MFNAREEGATASFYYGTAILPAHNHCAGNDLAQRNDYGFGLYWIVRGRLVTIVLARVGHHDYIDCEIAPTLPKSTSDSGGIAEIWIYLLWPSS